MKLRRHLAFPLLAVLIAGTACNRGDEDSRQSLADKVGHSISEQMATESIKLGRNSSGLPTAELTAQGEFLVDGRQVPLDADQQALVMQYRQQLAAIAEASARVGLEGAAVAGTAVTELAKAAFSGDMDKAEKRIERQAESVEASARLVCAQMPLLIAAERRLAESVPQFAPYASLDERDTKDCLGEVAHR